jgi:putative phosphoesterase
MNPGRWWIRGSFEAPRRLRQGYGPDPNECIGTVRENGFRPIMGNHDHEVIYGAGSIPEGAFGKFRFNRHAARAIEINRNLLTPDSRAFLEALPSSLRLNIDGVNIAVYHGSPRAPLREYVMPVEARLNAALLIADAGSNLLILGHTHIPYAIEHEGSFLLNPGSVGQPRDGDPRASYALVDIAGRKINSRIRRVEYDIVRTQEKMRRLGLPESLTTRLRVGR